MKYEGWEAEGYPDYRRDYIKTTHLIIDDSGETKGVGASPYTAWHSAAEKQMNGHEKVTSYVIEHGSLDPFIEDCRLLGWTVKKVLLVEDSLPEWDQARNSWDTALSTVLVKRDKY